MRTSTRRAVKQAAHLAQHAGPKTAVFREACPLHSRAAMKNTPFLFAVFLQLVACSSSTLDGTVAGESGFERSRTVASLTADEADRLCDWSLEKQGGAGKETKCDATSSRVVHTKEQCLEDITVITKLSGCYAVTVAEVEDCSKEEGAAPCTRSAACDALNDRLEKCAGDD